MRRDARPGSPRDGGPPPKPAGAFTRDRPSPRPSGPRPSGPRPEPRGQKPFTPGGSKSFRPGGPKSFTPGGSKPFTPGGPKPFTPDGPRSFKPGGETPFKPRGQKSFRPGGQKPFTPRGEKPFTPDGRKPFKPGGRKPFTPGGRQPFTPGERKPFTPGGHASFKPGGRKTFTPGGKRKTPRPAPAAPAAPSTEPPRAPAAGIRLQKLLSTAGIASRRASEQFILDGRVSINGETVRELGTRADPATDDIRVDGRRIRTDIRHRYIAVYKPKGYVTTRSDPQGRPTVIDLLGPQAGYIYPVGRLDYDSEGLLLLTTDGDLAEALTHPRHEVARVYEAIVGGIPDEPALERLRHGIFIDGRRTAPAEVVRGQIVRAGTGTTRLTITLREGRNRQVRRMCAAVGHPVRSLVRTRIGPLTLGRLRPGEWRELTAREVETLGGTRRP